MTYILEMLPSCEREFLEATDLRQDGKNRELGQG